MTKHRPLVLEWGEHQGLNCLQVVGWSDTEFREIKELAFGELSRRLAIFPSEFLEAGVDSRTVQPIAGRFELDEDAIRFFPRFPFLDGVSYSLLVNSANEGAGTGHPEIWNIQRPALNAAPITDVISIYPSAHQLPVNQLKLYIHFSNPMSEGWVGRAVHIRRADDAQSIEGVFLTMEPELWDPERRRLTLLLDPGRIKRGLAPHAEAGYPLNEGVPVIITVATNFQDAEGRPLRTGAEQRYEIGPLVRVKVDPADWRRHAPAAGTADPLTVEFDRPLDHALLQHCIWVHDAAGLALSGSSCVGTGEQSWCFNPESPWEAGQYQVIIDPRLEDLAGNSLSRVFDRDLTKVEDTPIDAKRFAIDFTCASPATYRH